MEIADAIGIAIRLAEQMEGDARFLRRHPQGRKHAMRDAHYYEQNALAIRALVQRLSEHGDRLPLMTGFLATMTDEQRSAALAYKGPDNHGPTP